MQLRLCRIHCIQLCTVAESIASSYVRQNTNKILLQHNLQFIFKTFSARYYISNPSSSSWIQSIPSRWTTAPDSRPDHLVTLRISRPRPPQTSVQNSRTQPLWVPMRAPPDGCYSRDRCGISRIWMEWPSCVHLCGYIFAIVLS